MATLLGNKEVGSIVKLNENGVAVNYIVVQQDMPSSIYDSSCDGIWLLRQDLIEKRVWDSGNVNKYEESDIHSWLNSTMLAKYDSNIQSAVKQVKIPYRQNGGSGGTDRTGANGLQCKVFLLSGREVGFTDSECSNLPNDGTKLAFFNQNGRLAKLNGSAAQWSLRSPYTNYTQYIRFVDSAGNPGNYGAAEQAFGVRPSLVLSGASIVLDDGVIVTNIVPTAPESIMVPDVLVIDEPSTIEWTAATDPYGTVVSYMLERSINGSGWTQIFSGNALTYTDTIGEWGTVAYRVCAVDNEGAAGDYATSNTYTVQEGVFYISGPASDMGEKTAPFDFTITTGISGDAQAVSGVTCTILLDGYTLHTDSTSTGEQTTVNIDVRTISGGAHTITVKADKTDYVSAVEQYTFTTPEIAFPDGGKTEQLQDQTGKAIFPQTTAALVQGIAGKSLAGNLEELYSGLVYGEGLDTLLLSVLEG